MEFQAVFPVWDKLTKQQQDRLLGSLITRSVIIQTNQKKRS